MPRIPRSHPLNKGITIVYDAIRIISRSEVPLTTQFDPSTRKLHVCPTVAHTDRAPQAIAFGFMEIVREAQAATRKGGKRCG